MNCSNSTIEEELGQGNGEGSEEQKLDLALNEQKQQILLNYIQKTSKYNMLLEGKRLKKDSKQTVGLPVVYFQKSIGFGSLFEIFGGVDISTNCNSPQQQSASTMPIGSRECFLVAPVIAFNKRTNISSMSFSSFRVAATKFEFINEILERSPDENMHALAKLVKIYQREVNLITSKIPFVLKLSSSVYAEMQEDYAAFVEFCEEKIASTIVFTKCADGNGGEVQAQSGRLIKYAIGKMNYQLGDIQITKVGTSEAYLNLLGLTHDLFTFALMRGNVPNVIDETSYDPVTAMQDILQRVSHGEDMPRVQEFKITTIDGFNLTVNMKFSKIESPFRRHIRTNYDHICHVKEYFVSSNQLNALRLYRENLLKNNKEESFSMYVHRQISGFFEHVEYSVYSQMFLEKFYGDKGRDISTSTNNQERGMWQWQK